MAFEAQHLGIACLADSRDGRRAALLRETPAETLERFVLGTAWALQPKRIGGLSALGRLWLTEQFAPPQALPDPNHPLNAGGLCGLVKVPSASTVVQGYKSGLFTFAHYWPLKWVSLPERCILLFDDFHIATNVRRFLRQRRYTVTFDRDRRDGRYHGIGCFRLHRRNRMPEAADCARGVS